MREVKKMGIKISENDVKKAILDCLAANHIFAWRNNTGAFAGEYNGKKRFFRYGAKGSGDIFALRDGIFYSLEVKAPGKVPSDDQNAWMDLVRKNGGRASCFDNIDSFIEWFNKQISL